MGCSENPAGTLADAAGARGVRAQRAGLFDRAYVGGVEAGNRSILGDLCVMKRASAVMTGLQGGAVVGSSGSFEGLMDTCTNHDYSQLVAHASCM